MRDAVGGTFMMRIFLIFLATFIIFVGIALNYAKAFRAKNKIIDIIEQNEGILSIDMGNGPIFDIESYLSYVNYNVTNGDYVNRSLCESKINTNIYDVIYYDSNRGYCVGRSVVNSPDPKITKEYYEVVTFVVIKIPMFDDLVYPIPIKGETRIIERINP